MRRWWQDNPGLVLYVLAPVFGELFSGSTPLNEYIHPFAWATLTLLYGGGAIVVRELVVRWRKGWWSLFLLGVAYGIFEEGLVVRSFFDPNWVDLGNLGVYGRVAGVNWVWAEHLSLYHALISIAASVAFVEMLYPHRRKEPWVYRRRWWWGAWLGMLLVLALGQALNPYDTPNGWVALTWLSIGVLVLLARLWPEPRPRTMQPPRVRPRRFLFLGFLGIFGQFFIVYLGADEGKYPFLWAMLLLALYGMGVYLLLRRWTDGWTAWDDRHRMALVVGALSFFLVFVPLTNPGQPAVVFFSNPVFLLFLGWAYRKVSRRVTLGGIPSSPMR